MERCDIEVAAVNALQVVDIVARRMPCRIWDRQVVRFALVVAAMRERSTESARLTRGRVAARARAGSARSLWRLWRGWAVRRRGNR